MNKKLILASLAAWVVFFLGGGAIYQVILKHFYDVHMTEGFRALQYEKPLYGMLLGSTLLFAVLNTWVLQRTGSTTPMKAIWVSAWLNLMVSLAYDLLNSGTYAPFHDVALEITVDVAANVVLGAVVGLAAGWVLGRE